MKSSMNWQDYRALAGSSQPQHSTKLATKLATKPGLGAKLNQLWRSVVVYLAASSEPYVWTTTDTAGQLQWHAYDPITHRSAQVSSEAELRIWLEERHYQYHLASH